MSAEFDSLFFPASARNRTHTLNDDGDPELLSKLDGAEVQNAEILQCTWFTG